LAIRRLSESVIRSLTKEIKRSHAKRGIIGTIRFILAKMYNHFLVMLSLRKMPTHKQNDESLEFDIAYGINTAGNVQIGKLDIDSENYIYAVRYEPIHIVNFSEILDGLSVAYEHFNFVDFGSGKGRAIILASSLPFKKIIGVEFSNELNSIAKDNLSIYPEELKKCKNIEIVCVDAAEYTLPQDDPLVLYFYNPFDRPVMAQVANNLIVSYKMKQRRIIIIYFTPECADIFDGISFLKKKKATKTLCVYDTED